MRHCPHCNADYANPSSLKRHVLAKHAQKTRYPCLHCHMHFARPETVERHIRSKHKGDLSTCSLCSKRFRADYMSKHRAVCARKYWRKIEQHASLSDTADMAESRSRLCSSQFGPFDELRFWNKELSKAPDNNHTLRIFHENTLNARLAADALSHMLLCFEEIEDVESYKAALVTALRLNITISDLRRPHKQLDCFTPLYRLAIHIDQLARGEKQINDFNDSDETILHAACRAGFAEILEPLFWRGACFNTIDKFRETPLNSAISSRDIDTVRFALALGSDPSRGRPLCVAFSTGIYAIMTLLVEHGADVNQQFNEPSLLSHAIRTGDMATFRLALSLGADVVVAHPIGDVICNCLMYECYGCVHEEMACLLVEQRAVIQKQYCRDRTIFHFAAIKAHIRLLRSALDQISSPVILDLEDWSSSTALHCAIIFSHGVPLCRTLTSVSMLLQAGADVNLQDKWGMSALMIAASTREGSVDLVRLLLDAGAAVKVQSRDEQTPLSLAADRGHSTIVRLLLERAPPTHEDKSYLEPALRAAVVRNHGEIVQHLLSFGADVHVGKVLSSALEWSSCAIVRILIKAGAGFDQFSRAIVPALFRARHMEPQENELWLCEASAKCELLIRTFPSIQKRYGQMYVIRANCLPEAE